VPGTQPSAGTPAALRGRYAIHAEIASGGMATVHLGRLMGPRGFTRTVAIKVLHESFAKDKAFVERFLDEARLVARIHHPNVMPTLDVIAEDDNLRIVMSYVAGESLALLASASRAKGERVPLRIASAIMSGVLHGLHAAHEAKNEYGEPLGIVHLDVSPQNVLVGIDGVSRVLDFGVARAKATGVKSDGPAGGKSAYLAPEQVRGGEVSPRTDVFAASVVLWELVTGEPLFAGDNHAATMHNVLGGVIPAASERVTGVPPRLDQLLLTGLKRDPNQRFATARDIALELEQAIPPALASEVGRWVEEMAAPALATRAAEVKAMEISMPPALPGLVEPRAMYGDDAAVNLPSDDLIEDLSGSSFLEQPPPGANDRVPQRAADGSIRWQPRKDAAATPRVARAAPAVRPPASKSATAVARPKAARSWRGLALILAASLGALALMGFVARALFVPAYVRSTTIEEAAAHGVTLTVKSASLSSDGVELQGLVASLAGVGALRITIPTADVRDVFSARTSVVLRKVEISMDGDAREVLASLGAWSAAHRGKTRASSEAMGGTIEMPAAHLTWTRLHDGVGRAEASLEGTLGAPGGAAIADDGHLLGTNVRLETSSGTFGPWSLDVAVSLKGTRARLALDPAVPDGPNALLIVDASGESTFDVTVPRVPVTTLGIPRSVVRPGLPFPQATDVALHYAHSSDEQVVTSLRAGFYGLHVPELGGLVDAHLSGDVSGAAGASLPLKNGAVTLGPLRPSAFPPALRANLAWKAEPVPCSALAALPTPTVAASDLTRKAVTGDLGDLGELARDLGALGQAVGAVKVTGAFGATGTVAFDSDDPSHVKISTTTSNACGVALFQPKASPATR
jgi:hypothetical protein